jgi:hypothetical protein
LLMFAYHQSLRKLHLLLFDHHLLLSILASAIDCTSSAIQSMLIFHCLPVIDLCAHFICYRCYLHLSLFAHHWLLITSHLSLIAHHRSLFGAQRALLANQMLLLAYRSLVFVSRISLFAYQND